MLLTIGITMEAEAWSLLAATVASSNIFRICTTFSASVQEHLIPHWQLLLPSFAQVDALACIKLYSNVSVRLELGSV